jgi:hypothetical protein
MTLTAHVFPQFQQGLGSALQDLPTDTIKVALGNVAGPVTLETAGIQAAKLFADWTAIVPEITGDGYTAGGDTLSGVSISVTGDVWTLTATSPEWPDSTLTANQAVWYDHTAETIQLIAFWDFGGAISDVSGTYELVINASGVVTATVS